MTDIQALSLLAQLAVEYPVAPHEAIDELDAVCGDNDWVLDTNSSGLLCVFEGETILASVRA